MADNLDGTFSITYDDGDHEPRVAEKFIRKMTRLQKMKKGLGLLDVAKEGSGGAAEKKKKRGIGLMDFAEQESNAGKGDFASSLAAVARESDY